MKNFFYKLGAAAVAVVLTALILKNDALETQVHHLEVERVKTNQQADLTNYRLDSIQKEVERLRETHPYQSRKWKNRKTGLCTQGNFFGFILYTPVDTTVSKDFAYVLSTYPGPKAKVNSVRRHRNPDSQHYHGKAIDLAWDDELIAFLISEGGKRWLEEHGVTLYIEGLPGSKRVKRYERIPEAAPYCFYNADATGDHIHLNI